jgi:hypothetical protein
MLAAHATGPQAKDGIPPAIKATTKIAEMKLRNLSATFQTIGSSIIEVNTADIQTGLPQLRKAYLVASPV